MIDPKVDFQVGKGVIASIPNFIVLAFIAIAIYYMDQGHIIPVDMYENDWYISTGNILLAYLLMIFLSIIMTFYPTYIYTILFAEYKTYWWSEKCGLILYSNLGLTRKDKIESDIRKISGSLVFIFWAFLLCKILDQFTYGYKWAVFVMFIICLIIFIGHIYFIKIGKPWKSNIIYGLALFTFFTKLFIAIWYGWCYGSIVAELFSSTFAAMAILSYRYQKSILTNLNFIHYNRIAGLIVLGIIILNNFSDVLAMAVNPINHFLMILISIYSLIVLSLKALMLLTSRRQELSNAYSGLLYYSIVIGSLVFLTVPFWNKNDLHRLPVISSTKNISPAHFYNDFKTQRDTSRMPMLYSAYGGGLKANYWNQLILNRIDRLGVLNNIIAMSGVSGGSEGIAMFSAAKFTHKPNIDVTDITKAQNILGLELSWIYGYDFIRKYLPGSLIAGQDRSYRSMLHLSKIAGNEELVKSISTQNLHYDLHKEYGYFPNVIFNSTATKDRYGVVSAVHSDGMFPGAILLHDLPDLGGELPFFHAVSTSNRFPGISPQAYIKGVGEFVDGGYFENSGIMSLLSFKKAMEDIDDKNTDGSIFKKKVMLISVRNGKHNYIDHLLSKTAVKHQDVQQKTQVGAILSAGLNLERLPHYMRSNMKEYLDNEYEIVYIDLPYYLSYEDIEDYYGGIPSNIKDIQLIVDRSNKIIENVLKSNGYKIDRWGVINPPTSRLLSRPVQKYMAAMMNHPDVLASFNRIK